MISHRSDIQGLRAIAVVAVIAFHFNLGLPGGFLGVDMFFVVSGFVIGGVLLREFEEKGTIHWFRFFLKRFFRLIPALSVVTSITLLVQYLFFTYPEIKETSTRTGLSAQLGISNFVIALDSDDYFGLTASRNPFLHTWSLSIEWQFYALFGVLLAGAIAFYQLRARIFVPLLIGIWAMSLLGVFVPVEIGGFPLNGFYSPFTRVWEFITGLLVVYLVARRPPQNRHAAMAVLVGLLGIGVALLSAPGGQFGHVASQVAATFGTALMIWGGTLQSGLVGRALSSKLATWIGDRSYSLYLWHWPLFVMWVQYGLTSHPEGTWLILLLGITVSLSGLSFRYLEEKLRASWREGKQNYRRLAFGLFVLPFLIAGGWVSLGQNYERFTQQAGLAVAPKTGEVGQEPFFLALEEDFFDCTSIVEPEFAPRWKGFVRCKQSEPSNEVRVALLGDSHAEHLFPGLAQELKGMNVAYFIDGVLPIRGETAHMDSLILGIRNSPSIEYVIISARWEGRGIPIEKMSEVIREFVDSGKEVILTDDIPYAVETPSHCKFSKSLFSTETMCESGPGQGMNRETIESSLANLAATNDATLVSTYSIFCPAESCSISNFDNSKVLYRDYDHLNFEGSREAAKALLPEIVK